MRIGGLDQRVTLISVASSRDAAGAPATTATDVATVWAAVMALKGEEALKAAQQTASRSIRVKLRHRTDVLTKWRLRWNGDEYDITDVDHTLARDGELWLTAVLRRGA